MNTPVKNQEQEKPLSPRNAFSHELKAMQHQLKNVLPNHITPEKFMRTVMMAVNMEPGLLNCDRASLKNAAIKCAADGLLPDKREAAFVKYGNSVVYMPMFGGIQKRVRNSGDIASIEARVIYEHDEFSWLQGTESKLVHIPKFPGDRGTIVGAYAMAHGKTGMKKWLARLSSAVWPNGCLWMPILIAF